MRRELPDIATLASFAKEFIAAHPQGSAVGLVGDLGAGKTTFVRACIEAIGAAAGSGPAPRVVSPSFTIQQSYKRLPRPVEHFDLYRLERLSFSALVDMGYFEAFEEMRAKQGFVFVEWPERAGESLLQLDQLLVFTMGADGRRAVEGSDTKKKRS